METIVIILTTIGVIATSIGSYYAYTSNKHQNGTKSKTPKISKFENEEEFVNVQIKLIKNAKNSVLLCLHTANVSSKNWKADKINKALVGARSRGVQVCVLTSAGAKQLSGAYELFVKHHINFRMIPELRCSDLRFLIVDLKSIVLGFSDTDYHSPEYAPSQSWGKIDSLALAEMLKIRFYQLWFDNTSYSFFGYLNHFLAEQNKGNNSPSVISKEIGIPTDFIINSIKNHSNRRLQKNDYVFVFHGKSASGKSQLINYLSDDFQLKELDLVHLVLPYVEKYGNENVTNVFIKDIYTDLLNHVSEYEFDIIETGSELVDFLLPKLFDILQKKNKKIKFIYCKADIKTSTQRNSKRFRPVPESIIAEQEKAEASEVYKQICSDYNIEVITIDTTKDLSTTYTELKTKLGFI